MKPLYIHNVDFIQLICPVDEVITYFPVSTHLLGKKIHTLNLNLLPNGLSLSGNNPLGTSFDAYISLYDVEGNLVIDKLPAFYFCPYYTGATPTIDRVIDWEKSFIYWANRYSYTAGNVSTCLYFSAFIGGEPFDLPEKLNTYSLTLPVTSGVSEIPLYQELQAIADRRITGVYYDFENSSQMGGVIPLNAYLYLVPKSPSVRYINYIPLVFLMSRVFTTVGTELSFKFAQNIFFEPACIDFDRSKVVVRDSVVNNTLMKLIFTYE